MSIEKDYHFLEGLANCDLREIEGRIARHLIKCLENDLWVTKDGLEIPLQELSDKHLNNIIYAIEQKNFKIYGLADEWLPKLRAENERRLIGEANN